MSPERGSPIASWKQTKGLNHLQLYMIHVMIKIDVHSQQNFLICFASQKGDCRKSRRLNNAEEKEEVEHKGRATVVGSPFKAGRDVPVYRATGPVWGSLTAPLVSPIPPILASSPADRSNITSVTPMPFEGA